MRYLDVYKFMVFAISISVVSSTLSKSDSKKKKQQKSDERQFNEQENVVSEALYWKDVVDKHDKLFKDGSRNFQEGMVLGYVTPWNNHGYDIAKWVGHKFTHISPVWLQIKVQGDNYIITGTHDIDKTWVQEVKQYGKTARTKVVPRLLFEGWRHGDFLELIENPRRQSQLVSLVLSTMKNNHLDGIVAEIWNQLPSRDLLLDMAETVKEIANKVKEAGYTFILVIPPPHYGRANQPGNFGREEFSLLADSVDAFSLMTYDYSNFQNPGPNSPIEWMRLCVESLVPDKYSSHRKKILLGLNLYGLDHSTTGGTHLLGPQYIKVLQKFRPKIQYDHVSAEHYFEYKSTGGRHTVFYPSRPSIRRRIQLARDLNTGLSLWELGQGLDYFYNLL